MEFSPNDRHIIVITGRYDESLAYAKEISSELDSVEFVDQEKAQSFLGQELDAVIFDMHSGFNPNAFGAITGTIRGGGFLILLRPEQAPVNSLFLTRFNQILENTPKVYLLKATHRKSFYLPDPPRKNLAQVFATSDQENAVAAIIKVVTGHRRRPLVITSDRGRGKSSALGIAASKLAKKGIKNIIICAPSKKMGEVSFKHAELGLDGETKNNLTFYSPDELQQQKPKADLVLIDEAAAIPIDLLTSSLKHYSRIVFSSTQHGYEGCGRGFTINFRKVLDREAPEWKSCALKTPIRWCENDTLEQFTFDALLLNADAADDSLLEQVNIDDCRFSRLNKRQLLTDNTKLKQLFGLLVSAHYQTKPSDLMQLMDDDSISIFCLEANKAIVAVAVLIAEGNIDSDLSADIFSGKRRLQGHLVAQALSSNIGIESAITLSGERISRIAVHPYLQNKGLGRFLIQNVIDQSSADYLSTSYGANEFLLNFWKKAGFKSVHLGIKRDASSGLHSVTMLLAKTAEGLKMSGQAELIFDYNFPLLLSETFKELESEIVIRLLSKQEISGFSDADQKTLKAFANENRGYENSLYLIWNLVLSKLKDKSSKTLSEEEINILIIKVLQKHSWDSVKQKMGKEISGRKKALALLRKAVSKLL